MATLTLVDELTIAEHWLPAIVNADYSGLTDEEETHLNEWLEEFQSCIFSYDDCSEFAIDSVSGLMANCTPVKIWKGE